MCCSFRYSVVIEQVNQIFHALYSADISNLILCMLVNDVCPLQGPEIYCSHQGLETYCFTLCPRLSVRLSISNYVQSCERNYSYNFSWILLKLCRCFCQGLKMCMSFGCNLLFFLQFERESFFWLDFYESI